MSFDSWKEAKLGGLILFNPRESLVKNSTYKKIAMEKLQPFYKYISGYDLSSFAGGAKFRNGDTLVARITPCLENGKTAQVSGLDENEVGFGSTEFIVLREKPHLSDNAFIYYIAINNQFRSVAIQSMIGTSGRQRVQQSVLENFVVMMPSLKEQKSIAATLSCLDDKIELNNRLNKTLEEMAQAIFKNWFVDFEPFRNEDFFESEIGRIPIGWSVQKLGNFIDIKTGKKDANAASKKGRYKFFTCSQNELLCEEYSFNCQAIIVAGNGNFSVKWYKGKFEAYQRTYVIKSLNEDMFFPIYYTLISQIDAFTQGARGSVIKFLTMKNFTDTLILIPTDSVLHRFHDTISSIQNTIFKLTIESQELLHLRDALLPKLMSGEIRVPIQEE